MFARQISSRILNVYYPQLSLFEQLKSFWINEMIYMFSKDYLVTQYFLLICFRIIF